jgi:hypothetical protein
MEEEARNMRVTVDLQSGKMVREVREVVMPNLEVVGSREKPRGVFDLDDGDEGLVRYIPSNKKIPVVKGTALTLKESVIDRTDDDAVAWLGSGIWDLQITQDNDNED